MKISGSLKVYLITHIIVTVLLSTLFISMFIIYYFVPHINSILHNIFSGQADLYEYTLFAALLLRFLQYWAFAKRHWAFRILFFIEIILIAVGSATAEYPEINNTLLVLDAPAAVYLLFSKKVRQYTPFSFEKHTKTDFENWMYDHMAMDKFPAENTDDYLREFMAAQDNQYQQWKYPLAGKATPIGKARGNALLYSFFFFFTGILIFGIVILLFINMNPPLFQTDIYPSMAFLLLVSIANFFIGWRYVQLHYRRKYIAKMRAIESSRKRGRYKPDKKG